MLDLMGWIAPVAGAIVAFGLYGIEEIGVEIEDPFGRDPNDLPMDAIVETIRRNVRESMAL
jgi:putative membrane protein